MNMLRTVSLWKEFSHENDEDIISDDREMNVHVMRAFALMCF
jgi:hypothetical protein